MVSIRYRHWSKKSPDNPGFRHGTKTEPKARKKFSSENQQYTIIDSGEYKEKLLNVQNHCPSTFYQGWDIIESAF